MLLHLKTDDTDQYECGEYDFRIPVHLICILCKFQIRLPLGSDDFSQRFGEFTKFVGARLSTMVIEVGGVW